MKPVSISLVVFAMIFLLSSALPGDKDTDKTPGLVESERNDAESLQRRKPPVKIPGPKLIHEALGLTRNRLSDKPTSEEEVNLRGDRRGAFDSLNGYSRRKDNRRNDRNDRLIRGYETQEENSRAV